MGRKRRRFYRANLPTVIWNEKTNSALVEFVKGEFITRDESTANLLLGKGYPEVDLEAVNPPNFEVPKGCQVKNDIPVMPSDYNETASLNKQRVQAALKKSEKKCPVSKDASPKKVSTKKATKRPLKRIKRKK